ncbi:MAG: 50S ribosomal protein L29 [Saprospiraceae bacterium]|nr:50S ribosomal protein L29 [Saprospiraceae bacterium]
MPSKKYLELQDFSDSDLSNELAETEVQFQKLRFDHTIKGLDNPLRLREIRRDIARIQTEMRRRQLDGLSDEAKAARGKIRHRRTK